MWFLIIITIFIIYYFYKNKKRKNVPKVYVDNPEESRLFYSDFIKKNSDGNDVEHVDTAELKLDKPVE